MRVFVVEESPALAARLLERLQAVPELSVVGVARSVVEAIRIIPVLEPDLVITDTEAGDGGGLALLHVLQARRALARRGPRVLLWTGCDDPRRRAVAEGLGVEARFDKAREVDLLVDYCRQLARRHHPHSRNPLATRAAVLARCPHPPVSRHGESRSISGGKRDEEVGDTRARACPRAYANGGGGALGGRISARHNL